MYKICLIIFVFPYLCFSQISKKETDSLLHVEIPSLRAGGEIEKSLVLCKKIVKNYEFLNDKNGLIDACITAANISMNLYRLKSSFEYLEIAETQNNLIKNPVFEARIYGEFARNYDYLGYESLALENYNKAISILRKEKNEKKLLEYMYSVRGFLHEKNDRKKEYYEDAHKAYYYNKTVYTTLRLAKYFIVNTKKQDSAKFYLDRGEQLFLSNKFSVFDEALLKRMKGRYYFENKQYEKAISYYKESLLIFKKLNNPTNIKEDYKLLYEVYKAINDEKNEIIYLEKYTLINDSLNTVKKRDQEIPLKKIIKENKSIEEKSKIYLYLIFSVILLCLLMIGLFFRKRYIQQHNEKETLLQKKDEEHKELSKKVNESFEEVIHLAKDNSPEFLTRFKEVYPEYYQKLNNIEPKLLETEIKLCAMLFLGFSSKDIAEYTFVTLKAAQHRKFRLRKKLGIPSDVDIRVWIEEYIPDNSSLL